MKLNKEIVASFLVVEVTILLMTFMPYIVFFFAHLWNDAVVWDCNYNGGAWTATTTQIDGFTHICTQP